MNTKIQKIYKLLNEIEEELDKWIRLNEINDEINELNIDNERRANTIIGK